MKATTVVGMVLGILGGLIALLIGAGGFGIASVGGQVSDTIGYQPGVSNAIFYRIVSILFPAMAIVGAGLATKYEKISNLLSVGSLVGILWIFGLNTISIVPCLLIGLGVAFVNIDSLKPSENGFAGIRITRRDIWLAALLGVVFALVGTLLTILLRGGETLFSIFLMGTLYIFCGIAFGIVRCFLAATVAFILNALLLPLIWGVGLDQIVEFLSHPVLWFLSPTCLAMLVAAFMMSGRLRSSGRSVFRASFLGSLAFIISLIPSDLSHHPQGDGIVIRIMEYESMNIVAAVLIPFVVTAIFLVGARLRPTWFSGSA